MLCDSPLSRVSDAELVNRLTTLVQSGRRVTAEILMHLAEIEDRRLHLKDGYNSLFSYCLAVHGMSEDEACRRIEVARLGRRYNSIFGLLASGALSLSVAALLKDCLTDENQSSLLAAMSGKSVRAAREELATRFPMPEAPSSIRKLPQRATSAFTSATAARERSAASNIACNPPETWVSSGSTRDSAGNTLASSVQPSSTRDRAGSPLDPSAPRTCTRELTDASLEPSVSADSTHAIAIAVTESSGPAISTRDIAGNTFAAPAGRRQRPSEGAETASVRDDSTNAGVAVAAVATAATFRAPAPSPGERAHVEPLSPGRYRVQFTASLAQKQKFELALDLMSHRNPSRDLAAVVERGLDLLIEELLRTRMGKSNRPQSAARTGRKERVSNETRRVVVERDGLQCAFVDERGQRCEGRAFLEFDHEQPLGKDGGSEPSNVRLLCRAHNRYCAELDYGRSKIEREIAHSKDRRGTRSDSVHK